MSTVSKKIKQPQRPENAAAEKPLVPPGKAAKGRPRRAVRRHFKWGGIGSLAVLAVVALLPTILVHTPLLGMVLRRAAKVDGSLTFKSASLGWFSSASIVGLAIRDAQGEPVIEAESITCDRTLLRLIFGSTNLGTLKIAKPRLTAKFSREGSNLETVFARWAAGSSSTSKPGAPSGVDLTLEIADGEATIADQDTRQSWHVTNLQFALDLSRRMAWPTRVEASAALDGHGGGSESASESGQASAPAPTLALKAHVKASDAPPADAAAWSGLAGTDGDVSLQISALPLALLQRFAAMGLPGAALEGTLDVNVTGQWSGPANVKLQGTADASNFSLAAAALGSDVLRLDRVQATCHAARQGQQVTIDDTKLACDVATLSAGGQVDLGQRGITSLADLLSERDGGIQGTLDLARLAHLLPSTMHVPAGTQIASGEVNLTIRPSSAPASPDAAAASAQSAAAAPGPASPTATAWHAHLASTQIVAVQNGRQIRWDKPIAIDLDVHPTDHGPAIDNVTCESDFLSVRATGTTSSGLQLNFDGDLARLEPWLAGAAGASGVRLGGRLTGTATIEQSEGNIACKAESDIEQLTFAAPSGQTFQDPRVHCAIQCSYQTAAGILKIDQCELTCGVLGAKAGGQVAFAGEGDVQVNGNISYQWDKINAMLQPYSGTSLVFNGGGTSTLDYRGPLDFTRGEANTAVRFGGANVYGFQLGPSELKMHLAGGILRTDAMQVACNQGTITVQPEIRLAAQPPEFRMSAGTLADHVQLDASACRSMLRYVIPVISSATQSQGKFSVQLEGCRISLGDLKHAEIAGRVIVHSATMSPGPVVQQLTPFLTSPPTLVNIPPETVILFRMTDGRIYHQNLLIEVAGLQFRTYGSVGLDDSLKIMIETSVPLHWLPANAVTDAIRKQKIQVPMAGTLSSPRLDAGELARAMAQVGGNVARGLLDSNLGNQLRGLVRPGQ